MTLLGGSATAASALNPLDHLCPTKDSPAPELPEPGLPPGTGDYHKFGYAGLYWTTYDQSCLSVSKLDNSVGNNLNDLATGIDGLVNQAQGKALDPHFTDPLRRVVDTAVPQLRAVFWDPKMITGMAGAAVVLLFAWASGKETEAMKVAANVLLVLGGITFLLVAPGRISQMSANATAGVASDTGKALSAVAGQPTDNPSAAFTQGYYSISYRAWADGMFCYNRAAADHWAPAFREAQAYTVDEARAIETDPKLAKAIKHRKQQGWQALAMSMSKTDPVAYDCWSNQTSTRFKSGIRHLVVSVAAGIWVIICAFGLLILQDMLMLGMLLAVGLGAVMIALRRVSERMAEYVLMAAVGAPFVALLMGVLLTGYFVILSDPALDWITSTILAIALGAAVWFSWPFLRRMFMGPHSRSRRSGFSRARGAGAAGRAAWDTLLVGAGAVGGAAAEAIHRDSKTTVSGDDRSENVEKDKNTADDPTGRETGDTKREKADLDPKDRSWKDANGKQGDGKRVDENGDTKRPEWSPVPDDADDRREDQTPGWYAPTEDEPILPGDETPDRMTEEERSVARDMGMPRSPLTREEEERWREMASAQLQRFGHDPMGPVPTDVEYADEYADDDTGRGEEWQQPDADERSDR